MNIYSSSDSLILAVTVDDNSYRNRQIMGDHNLTLYYSLAEHTEIPVGSYVEYQGVRYTLDRPEAFKMKHRRLFEYTVTFEAYQSRAKRWKFRNTVDGRLKFPLTATPREHLQMFVDNMNRRDSGWTIGSCITGVEHLVNYDNNYCIEALQAMAEEFGTEFEISGKTVSLHKVEYNKSNPLPLSYGRGNGFKPNVGRSNSGDAMPVEILFAVGGEDNIDPHAYGNRSLLLPEGGTIGFDGVHFSDEEGFDATNARYYAVSEDRLSIQRSDKELSSQAEDSLDCTDIYPKRVGTVGQVIVVDADNHFYDFTDTDPAADPCPDYEECLIAGETMTVRFQSGMLAGREFEVKYNHNAKTEKGVQKLGRRFEIVPQEIDGVTMPDATFKPAANDTYAVFHCAMPTGYISKAEADMFRAAVRYMYEHEDQRFSFTGELDGIWAKKDWTNIGGRIVLGGYIRFTDESFQADPVLVRITGIKDYINNPHSPEITLSNETITGGFSSEFKRVQAEEVTVEDNYRRGTQFTKRRFRDAQETMKMIEQALIEGYTQSISPIAAQMLQLLVGDESLQYRFVTSHTTANPTVVTPVFAFDSDTGIFTVTGGYYLQHLTIGVQMKASHAVSEYKWWAVQAYTSAVLDDPEKRYYLYLKCPVAGGVNCEYILSQTAIKMTAVTGYYHFLVGVLNSEYEGERSFASLYGFTEITGGRITTDKIVSSDGNTYFDLAGSKIGGFIDFVDGLVSGLIGVGNTQGVNAGLNGEGNANTDIRFWAGQTAANKASAPFRVQHNGKMFASDAEVSGTINADKGILNNVTVQGSMSSPIVLWRTKDIKVSGNSYVYTRYPYGDASSSAQHRYCFANFYKSGNYIYTRTIFCNTENPSVGTPYWSYSTATEQLGTITEVAAVNVIDGNADGSGRHDNVILPQLGGTGTPQVITAEQFSWDASNIGRCVRLLNYKYASEPDGYIKLEAPSGKYFYECGYQTTSIRLSREYVELYGYGADGVFYGWIVVNRQDIKTRGEYGMPWKVIYQGCVNPYASVQIERLWDVNLDIQGEGSVDYGYQKLETGRFKITLPKLLSKYNPITGTTMYEKCWHVIIVPRSCLVDGTAPSQDHITCGYACLAAKGHENGKSYFIVETADDASKNDLGFDFYVISMANWIDPTVNQ